MGDTVQLTELQNQVCVERFKSNQKLRNAAYAILKRTEEVDNKIWDNLRKELPNLEGYELRFNNEDGVIKIISPFMGTALNRMTNAE